jgi:hypothetical protein
MDEPKPKRRTTLGLIDSQASAIEVFVAQFRLFRKPLFVTQLFDGRR